MKIYILDSYNLDIKYFMLCESYSLISDIDLDGRSQARVAGKYSINEGDFIVTQNEGSEVCGVIQEIQRESNSDAMLVIFKSMENIFDERLASYNEGHIATYGIEYFIKSNIETFFSASSDELTNMSYIEVIPETRTYINAKLSTITSVENGVYNFKTFLGNCREKYGIVLSFKISTSERKLYIRIKKDNSPVVPVDLTLLDYTEEKQINVLAKLRAYWNIFDDSTQHYDVYFLLNDRTITKDMYNPNRAKGRTDTIKFEVSSEAEALEKITQEFKSNSYQHKIIFSLDKNSKLFNHNDFQIGRSCLVKTKTGMHSTIVTQREESSSSSFVTISFGKLKVTLIDKLRGKYND